MKKSLRVSKQLKNGLIENIEFKFRFLSLLAFKLQGCHRL